MNKVTDDDNLESIRHYKGDWNDFFTYWKKRGVIIDPHKNKDFMYPKYKKQEDSNLPIQDFNTYDKKKFNKVIESFEEFKKI